MICLWCHRLLLAFCDTLLFWKRKNTDMCFSASASFGTSVVLGTIGVVTLAKVKRCVQLLFAFIPVMFAVTTTYWMYVTDFFFWFKSYVPESFFCLCVSDVCADHLAGLDPFFCFVVGEGQSQNKDADDHDTGFIRLILPVILPFCLWSLGRNPCRSYSLHT